MIRAAQGRMHALLDALGRPQRQLQVAHISGTKGKGSTAVMLSSIMKAAGYKVGTYTRHAAPTLPALGMRSAGSGHAPAVVTCHCSGATAAVPRLSLWLDLAVPSTTSVQ